jgi:hypothetical protein
MTEQTTPAVERPPAHLPRHKHQWRKEYREASEANDFRWVCDCGETHGMRWKPEQGGELPATEAGRAFLRDYRGWIGSTSVVRQRILDIEDQAYLLALDHNPDKCDECLDQAAGER